MKFKNILLIGAVLLILFTGVSSASIGQESLDTMTSGYEGEVSDSYGQVPAFILILLILVCLFVCAAAIVYNAIKLAAASTSGSGEARKKAIIGIACSAGAMIVLPVGLTFIFFMYNNFIASPV